MIYVCQYLHKDQVCQDRLYGPAKLYTACSAYCLTALLQVWYDHGMQITEQEMTSDVTPHRAEWSSDAAADGNGAWVVSWLPLRLLSQDQAVTAMVMAENVAQGRAVPGHRVWAHFENWARELHLTAAEALARLKGGPDARA